MRALRYSNGQLVVQTVVSLNDLGDLTDTVLDEQVEGNGAWIILPCKIADYRSRPIDRVFVPPYAALREGSLIILSVLQSAAQNLLVRVDEFILGEIDTVALTRSLKAYQMTVVGLIMGRRGVLSQHIIGCRMKRSGRAVLLARAGGQPFIAEVPKWMMKKAKVEDGDLIIIGRDPTIWDGGIEVLKARGIDENVIRLHPLVFKQLNADSDGDQVWFLAIPQDNENAVKQALKQLGGFMRKTAQWPAPLNLSGDNVDWDNVKDDLAKRAEPTGFSISPEDILEGGEYMTRLENITGKTLREECIAIAKGLPFEKWQKTIIATNEKQLRMKVGMGPVGAAAIAIRLISGSIPSCARSACLVAERLEQKLLDSKRAKDKGTEEYDHNDALDILHMRGKVPEDAKSAAKKLGKILDLEPYAVRPVVRLLYNKYEMGLSGIIRTYYPWFTSTTRAADNNEMKAELALRLFGNKERDVGGVVQQTLDSLVRGEINVSKI